jgi:phage tail sheath gpL-like
LNRERLFPASATRKRLLQSAPTRRAATSASQSCKLLTSSAKSEHRFGKGDFVHLVEENVYRGAG